MVTDSDSDNGALPPMTYPEVVPTASPQRAAPARRKPLALWDRVKFLVLLGIIWGLSLWASMANNPLLGFNDAVNQQLKAKWWLLTLAGIEIVRQVHYLVSEHWSRYHRMWTLRIFGA